MKKWDNFQASLKNLSAIYDEEPPYDVVTLTGMVALFQICFEQSWKAMKEVLEEQGYTEFALGSPKRVIKTAFEARIITEEDVWLEALQAHNNVAHSYNEQIALSIVEQTKESFYPMFCALRDEMAQNWIE